MAKAEVAVADTVECTVEEMTALSNALGAETDEATEPIDANRNAATADSATTAVTAPSTVDHSNAFGASMAAALVDDGNTEPWIFA